jgi:hypothetical protein
MDDVERRAAFEKDLENRFKYHAPDSDRAAFHEQVRGVCYNAALALDQLIPDGREKSLVITKLEEVMFWSNAALARMP